MLSEEGDLDLTFSMSLSHMTSKVRVEQDKKIVE